ncbi:MAG: DNA-directed RNA polymerase subunit L [Candidatus Micrarchaeota archaeon]|nr:DNA-directed RNA polymerase subunit L [Candidatus Micrarchaeota archaeon]
MEVVVLKNEPDYLEIEIKGEEYGLAGMLKELLLQDERVEFAAYRMDHPQVASPVLMIRTSQGKPMTALKQAIKRLKKEAEEFKEAIASAKKPKK